MFGYAYKDLSRFRLNFDSLERILLKRFEIYHSSSNSQFGTDELDCYYDRMVHLLMCFIAIDYRNFEHIFLQGELKIYVNRLKKKSCSDVQEELSELMINLKYLSQREEIRKFGEKDKDCLQLMMKTLQNLIENCSHAFGDSHSENCFDLTLTLPFTFLLESVAKREVELSNGKIKIGCGMWMKVVKVIFHYFLELEMNLLKNCKDLREIIYDLEDDRLRQIIKRFTNMLKGRIDGPLKFSTIRASEIDFISRYFPPCMANLHQILKQSHRLSYESRYQYTLFLKDIGVPVNENIAFWKREYSKPPEGSKCTHEWTKKEKRYTYQIEHIYGLIGNSYSKTSHTCDKFIEELKSKMDAGCPFQHSEPEILAKCIPKSISELTDVEDIFRYKDLGLPRKACAVYLSCQREALSKKSPFSAVSGAVKLACVISPLQYFNAAINSL